jgi:hypothetical protein
VLQTLSPEFSNLVVNFVLLYSEKKIPTPGQPFSIACYFIFPYVVAISSSDVKASAGKLSGPYTVN